MNKNVLLYVAILIFGLVAPFVFPAFKVQLSILCVLIVLATTWNIQGGEMGYNTFGNILSVSYTHLTLPTKSRV